MCLLYWITKKNTEHNQKAFSWNGNEYYIILYLFKQLKLWYHSVLNIIWLYPVYSLDYIMVMSHSANGNCIIDQAHLPLIFKRVNYIVKLDTWAFRVSVSLVLLRSLTGVLLHKLWNPKKTKLYCLFKRYCNIYFHNKTLQKTII